MQDAIKQTMKEALGRSVELAEVTRLHGDASYRTYYRAFTDDGRTFIIMQMPAGRASASEEITNFKGTHLELPFINCARYLNSTGIPVPKVIFYNEMEHLMVIEDLGDDLMANHVIAADADGLLDLYKPAVELLVRLQNSTANGRPSDCVAFARSFDSALLDWEFDHFLEYGIEARLGVKMNEADRRTFEKETRTISAMIQKIPYGFTHRDFQSRNIIMKDGAMYLIDFQDALLGPYVYDFISLTRDSYVELPQRVVSELQRHYSRLSKRPIEDVTADYDLVTVQRKLKDAGRFVYIDRVKKNSGFLKFIPVSLDYVRAAFGQLPEYGKLFELLKRYVPEFK